MQRSLCSMVLIDEMHDKILSSTLSSDPASKLLLKTSVHNNKYSVRRVLCFTLS